MVNQIQIFNYFLKNQADSTVDIHIDGDIVDSPTQEIMAKFFDDETSTSFKSLRNKIESETNIKTVNVYINSTGGHVGDAMAIHDYLKELETKGVTVNRRGRGIIASAATYVLMGNNSEMSENSFFMIHNVRGGVWGDINQMENQVKAARKFNDRIRDFYANETSNPPETIASWMNKETFMNATEAKERNFVKGITGEVKFNNSIPADHWQFTNRDVLNVYNSYTQQNQSFMDITKLKEVIKNSFTEVLKSLGIEAKAEDVKVVEAFDAFAANIENAIKQVTAPADALTEEQVKAIVNGMGFMTSDSIKDLVNKQDLTAALEAQRQQIVNDIVKAAGAATPPAATEPPATVNGRKRVKNRFSNAENWEVN
jgi:ATP-dependent protease ClpP protease subunit